MTYQHTDPSEDSTTMQALNALRAERRQLAARAFAAEQELARLRGTPPGNCETCGGRGRIGSDIECPSCGGKGGVE